MQTIDLGNISIGGEDLGAPKQTECARPPRTGCGCTAQETPRPAPVSPAPARKPAATGVCEPAVCEAPRPDTAQERREACACPCTHSDNIYFDKCEEHKTCHIGDAVMDGQGRILDLTLCLKNVCPGKRVAVGVSLCEIDARGNEYPRGMRTFTVPAHRRSCCTDIPVESIRFILPEDISVCDTKDICGGRRHFVAKVVAHYIDFNPVCTVL